MSEPDEAFRYSTGTADYGDQWWSRTFGQQKCGVYSAQGHGGQYVFVAPGGRWPLCPNKGRRGGLVLYVDCKNVLLYYIERKMNRLLRHMINRKDEKMIDVKPFEEYL